MPQQADYGAGSLSITNEHPEQLDSRTTTKSSMETTMDPAAVLESPQALAGNSSSPTSAQTPLPKCFCNWKNCRTYQKALREYKHVLFNGVIKLKFTQMDRKSMALKAAVDRTLHVDAAKRNEWKPSDDAAEDEDAEDPETMNMQCRYYVARHHFTEALMKQYLSDRRAWDWNEPLSMKQAKTFLWSLDRQDVYLSEDEEEDDDDGIDTRYVQAPNVPKDQVRELLKKVKEEYKKAQQLQQQQQQVMASPVPSTTPSSAGAGAGVGVGVVKKGGAANSTHTQSTLSTSVTDTLKAFEDIIGHQEVGEEGGGVKDVAALAAKEEENTRLRQELNECQEQLTMLHSMVKQLKVDMDKSGPTATSATKKKKGVAAATTAANVKNKNNNKPVRVESSSEEDEEDSDEEESSEEEEEEEEEEEDEEDGDWSNGRRNASRHAASDDDETISTFHVNSQGGSRNGRKASTVRSNNSGPGSVHSRRSVRRDSVHSRRNSIHSRSRHSVRRDSIHSRRSMRGGMDDAASVVSRQSLQSVSPSIKSLPREIELMDDEDEEEDTHGKDDYSFFDDSYRKPDDDARSVGSRSAASRASRRSLVSGARNRRNSRRPGQAPPPAATSGAPGSKKPRGARGSAVPREIDLSGDELEDETYANVSTDMLFVSDKQIVDPYGEKGVYTGALSKSTGMPNGKGRLEYEKEGRWYEGDWIHGRWTGYGRLSNGDGDFYEGGLKNDHKHGTGVMRFADGRVFEGEYIRGQMIQGKMTYQDGSVYGGSWVDGMRHGRGKCIFVDGSEYEGEFREGNFHGHGQMTWNDGGWYVGEWCDGEMHGKGKEIRPDGSLRHDGEWSRGQPIRSANDSRRRRTQQQQQQ
mmetsp:Transcript_20590/g.58356  ORF Transcript_20590/g.58356 Transcript_20590/m.58356 type:complete len:861 (-) Transcript_20590:63-2645(-)